MEKDGVYSAEWTANTFELPKRGKGCLKYFISRSNIVYVEGDSSKECSFVVTSSRSIHQHAQVSRSSWSIRSFGVRYTLGPGCVACP